ncbi:MAG TPA: putative manganese-dependent inorganic diphosphatase [Candidatus Saccharimonadales bacterium]|jgi:manganese-dependent inorganic pyrophosphatase|nr:putative manganese-dependent inorganic diphosphatase [Candidatus Saccharimonadales bacterium]
MSNSELLVIGHRNPDTDAICSAIGYAEFKRRTGSPHAEAARCGDTNDRIDFVLETFGSPPPRFVADVSPKVRDVMADQLISVPPDATVAHALGVMDEKNIRVLPVLTQAGTCQGLLSVFKMTKFFLPAPGRLMDSRRILASLCNLAQTLDAKMVYTVKPDEEEDLILMIGAMNLESFSRRLVSYPPERLVVVVGDRLEIQDLAIREGVRAVVVTGGLPVSQSMIDFAAKQKVSLLLSPHDTTTTAMLCRAAITVRHMIHEHFLAFREDEPLASIEAVAAASHFQAFPVINDQNRTIGILSKSDFLKKVNRQLILVDHNELSQAVQGAEQVEIVEIIDHHRLGALTTTQPILFRNEPVGSTSTIVADCFFRHQVELPKATAGLLLAGLVSDTLNLTSPTTTERDAQVLKKLEEISGVDADRFTEKLFASGSVLTSLPAAEAVVADCKEFREQGRFFSVAQIEELGFDQFWKRREEVFSALERYRVKRGYSFSALLVTDVVSNSSLLIVAGPESFLKLIDYPMVQEGVFELAGVVSRKKQLLPYLTHCLKKGGARISEA